MKLKPLDIVQTPKGAIALVVEVAGDGCASINYLAGSARTGEHNAWWCSGDGLVVLDSLPHLLAKAMAHPFGSNGQQADWFFPVGRAE